jgi:hypothetical protein
LRPMPLRIRTWRGLWMRCLLPERQNRDGTGHPCHLRLLS